MPAPRKFDRARLQAGALELVDTEGIAGLTMRSLAGVLGTGPMTIYNYVDGREGLEQLVAEAVMAEAHWPEDPAADWADEVLAVATGIWRAVRRHPNAIPLILTRRGEDVATLRPIEALLAALARSGRSGADLLIAFRVVSAFITGFAQAELTGPLTTARHAEPHTVINQITGLSPADFPHLIEIAQAAATSDPDQEFEAGLHLVLTALRAG